MKTLKVNELIVHRDRLYVVSKNHELLLIIGSPPTQTLELFDVVGIEGKKYKMDWSAILEPLEKEDND